MIDYFIEGYFILFFLWIFREYDREMRKLNMSRKAVEYRKKSFAYYELELLVITIVFAPLLLIMKFIPEPEQRTLDEFDSCRLDATEAE